LRLWLLEGVSTFFLRVFLGFLSFSGFSLSQVSLFLRVFLQVSFVPSFRRFLTSDPLAAD